MTSPKPPPKPEEGSSSKEVFVLHMFPFSLYSIMARLTYALAKSSEKRESGNGVNIVNKLVDVHRDENTTQDFLLNLNPKGQVPVLTGGSLEAPIADSLDISYWLAKFYPHILPTTHETAIREALAQLHSIQAFSLSVLKENLKDVVPCPDIDDALARSDISAEYRSALEFKRQFYRETLEFALREDHVADAKVKARALFATLLAMNDASDSSEASPWLLGKSIGPTILDGHVVPFIIRLLETKRQDLIPEKLQRYAEEVQGMPEWDEVMHGRPTKWNASFGHVRLLQPL